MRKYDEEYQDNESRRYMYDFDHVMRRYMIRTLSPFFTRGKALELGCFEGAMTKLIADHFTRPHGSRRGREPNRDGQIECSGRGSFRSFHDRSGGARPDLRLDLPGTYSGALGSPDRSPFSHRKLAELDGRFFVVVPNADAASRQIAVKMGLVDTNNAVTPGELAHGHRCTYSLDTLEYDVRRAGLHVESRGGILFNQNFRFGTPTRAWYSLSSPEGKDFAS